MATAASRVRPALTGASTQNRAKERKAARRAILTDIVQQARKTLAGRRVVDEELLEPPSATNKPLYHITRNMCRLFNVPCASFRALLLQHTVQPGFPTITQQQFDLLKPELQFKAEPADDDEDEKDTSAAAAATQPLTSIDMEEGLYLVTAGARDSMALAPLAATTRARDMFLAVQVADRPLPADVRRVFVTLWEPHSGTWTLHVFDTTKRTVQTVHPLGHVKLDATTAEVVRAIRVWLDDKNKVSKRAKAWKVVPTRVGRGPAPHPTYSGVYCLVAAHIMACGLDSTLNDLTTADVMQWRDRIFAPPTSATPRLLQELEDDDGDEEDEEDVQGQPLQPRIRRAVTVHVADPVPPRTFEKLHRRPEEPLQPRKRLVRWADITDDAAAAAAEGEPGP